MHDLSRNPVSNPRELKLNEFLPKTLPVSSAELLQRRVFNVGQTRETKVSFILQDKEVIHEYTQSPFEVI
jgi:hypothetical protein